MLSFVANEILDKQLQQSLRAKCQASTDTSTEGGLSELLTVTSFYGFFDEICLTCFHNPIFKNGFEPTMERFRKRKSHPFVF